MHLPLGGERLLIIRYIQQGALAAAPLRFFALVFQDCCYDQGCSFGAQNLRAQASRLKARTHQFLMFRFGPSTFGPDAKDSLFPSSRTQNTPQASVTLILGEQDFQSRR